MIVIEDGPRWLAFDEPVRVVCINEPGDVLAALHEVETAVFEQNLYAAGFLSYEASAAFGLVVHDVSDDAPPLLWFGLYEQPRHMISPTHHRLRNRKSGDYQLGTWQTGLTAEAYHEAIAAIKAQIAAGNTYQVNYTFPMQTTFQGDPWALFTDVVTAQPGM